jgi:hypothetical protein
MADTYKVLGQVVSVEDTSIDTYTVPSGKQSAVSSVLITNTGVGTTDYSLFAVPANEYDAIEVVTTVTGESYNIGDIGPAGGYICITPSTTGNTTGRYFEVAPKPIEGEVARQFCEEAFFYTPVTGADSEIIGSGAQNTLDIITQGNTDPGVIAAAYASQYSYGGFSDWFLPSWDEMQKIMLNRELLGNDFVTHPMGFDIFYGTSSEVGGMFVGTIGTVTREKAIGSKGTPFFIRPVRSFTPVAGSTTTTLTPLPKHAIIKSKAIEAGEHHEITGGITLSEGDSLLFTAGNDLLVINVYGVETL